MIKSDDDLVSSPPANDDGHDSGDGPLDPDPQEIVKKIAEARRIIMDEFQKRDFTEEEAFDINHALGTSGLLDGVFDDQGNLLRDEVDILVFQLMTFFDAYVAAGFTRRQAILLATI